MSCPFYWWNYHYACRKSGKDVNDDIYHKYCNTYTYDECPIYKGNDSGGCFLTSACVEAMNLPDNCKELSVLRHFRDTYLAQQPCGKCEINHYYHIAPMIVEKIRESADATVIFTRIYNELVLPCVAHIEGNNLEAAHQLYKQYTLSLEKQYLGAPV